MLSNVLSADLCCKMLAPNEQEYMMVFYPSNVSIFSVSMLISHCSFCCNWRCAVLTMSVRGVWISGNTGLKVLRKLTGGLGGSDVPQLRERYGFNIMGLAGVLLGSPNTCQMVGMQLRLYSTPVLSSE